MNLGDLFLRVRPDEAAFRRDMAGVAEKAGGEAGATLGQRLGAGIRAHSAQLAAGVGATVGVFVADAVQQFAGFQNSMNEVFTLLPGISKDAMADMTGQVKGFANEFGVLPDDVVPALYQSLSAGVPSDNVFAFLETANKAAKGGVTDLDTAVDGLTTVVNAFGSDVISAEEAADIMFRTVQAGKTTFAELSASMFQVAPIASSLGVSFTDVGAAIAALTVQGTPTRVATTQIRQALVELSKSGSATDKVFRDIAGVGFQEFIANGGNVQGALQLLEQHADATGVGIKDLFGSVEAGAAATALTGRATDIFSEKLGIVEDHADATSAAFETMESGVTAVANRIAARLRTFAIDLGAALEPVAPLFVAFGPTLGRALGAAFGAGFGLLVKDLPRLMAPVIAKMTAIIASSSIGQSLASALGSQLAPITAAGAGAGGAWAGAFRAAAAAALLAAPIVVPIIVQEVLKDALDIDPAGDLFAITDALSLGDEIIALDKERLAIANELNARYGEQGDEVDALRSRFDELNDLIPQLVTRWQDMAGLVPEAGKDWGKVFAEGAAEGMEEAATGGSNIIARSMRAVVDAAEAALEDLPDAVRAANREAAHEARLLGPSLRDAIRSGRQGVREAMADLRFAMTHPLRAVKIIAQVEGALTSKRLREGLRSGNPDVHRQAKLTKSLLIEQWQQLTGEAWEFGKSTSDNLAGGIRARRRAARQAARETKDAAKEELEKAPAAAETAGEGTSKSFATGIIDFIGNVTAAARAVAQAVADQTKPGSPTKEGPLSEAGGIEGWGQRLAMDFRRGLEAPGGVDIVSSLGLRALDPLSMTLQGSQRHTEMIRSSIGGRQPLGAGDTYSVTTYGLPMRAETPREVVQQLRRTARMGIVTPRRPRGWEPT